MPKARSENRDRAYKIYHEHGGKITNRAIADQLNINEKTVGGWKCKDKWDDKLNGVLRKNKRSTPKEKKPRGAQLGSKNALGNKGGPGGPEGNHHAEKHGFFSRIFPDDEETMEILAEIQLKSPIEILWDQIQIQYLAIARAQKLMFVKNQDDMTKVLKRTKDSESVTEREWELQHAWDKHASFLTAQSRAIKTLESLISKYEELLVKDLGTEEQKLRIEIKKAELDKIKNPTPDADMSSYVEALKSTAQEVWADEETENTKKEDPKGEADK